MRAVWNGLLLVLVLALASLADLILLLALPAAWDSGLFGKLASAITAAGLLWVNVTLIASVARLLRPLARRLLRRPQFAH